MFENCLPKASDRARLRFYRPLVDAMEEFEITSVERIAGFIAQVAHESGNLYYTEEIADGSNYEFREDLGNLEFEALQVAHGAGSTTGKWFKGRGLIQLTGYYNYLACSKALGVDYVNYPKLLSNPIDVSRSAAWFWKAHGCNELMDKGKFTNTTRVINGGTNGAVSRNLHYKTCLEALR